MRCHKYTRIDNVLTLQNITEHYPLFPEHPLFINMLTQNITDVSPRTNARRFSENWYHNTLVRGLTKGGGPRSRLDSLVASAKTGIKVR